jgi:possible arylsulfatase regulator
MYIKSIYTFLFVDNNHYYLYNSMSNFFSEISETFYNLIVDNSWNELPKDIIEELLKKGVIVKSKDKYKYYETQLLRFNAKNFDPTRLSLVIAPTTGCNFDCPYCFESKKNPKNMNEDVLNKLCEFILSHKDAKSMSITWYGGEPLMAFSTIKNFYDKISHADESDKYPEITYQMIVTNGYLFTNEMIDFFKEKKLNKIQITLDGLGAAHDAKRYLKESKKGSFDKILMNIDKLAERLPDTLIDIRVNINKDNMMDYVEVFRFIRQRYNGNMKISAYPGIIREETKDKCALCSTCYQTSELFDLYNTLREYGISFNLFPQKKGKGCMIQALSSYIIGPEGEIYKCWNDVGESDKIIGNIFNQSLNSSSLFIKYMLHTSAFNDECKDCLAFPLCDGGCGYHRYRNNFENCHFDLCSPLKNKEILKRALLSGELKTKES